MPKLKVVRKGFGYSVMERRWGRWREVKWVLSPQAALRIKKEREK